MGGKNVSLETPVVWMDDLNEGATYTLLFRNLAAAAVRVGARVDLGKKHRAKEYRWRLTVAFATPPVVDETVLLYLATSDGVFPDGGCGVADAAGDVNMVKNMISLGELTVTSIVADHEMTISGTCTIVDRYVSPVVHNNTADNLSDTAANICILSLAPITEQAGPY